MNKKYLGSCHCGAVRFEAEIDLSKGTGKCNCSICTKTRGWSAVIKPQAFQLLSGTKDLSAYRFATKAVEHLFCKHCGVKAFDRGYVEEIGGDFVSIKLATLDKLDPLELINNPIEYFDGANDAWWERPAETRHL